jgi:hypothetical protein
MAKKKEIDWWEITAYVIGIGAIIFTVVMILLLVLK